jgi:O-antigen ligase
MDLPLYMMMILMIIIGVAAYCCYKFKVGLEGFILFVFLILLQPSKLLRLNFLGFEMGSYLLLMLAIMIFFGYRLYKNKNPKDILLLYNDKIFYSITIYITILTLSFLWSSDFKSSLFIYGTIMFRFIMLIILVNLITKLNNNGLRIFIYSLAVYSIYTSINIFVELENSLGLINALTLLGSKDFWLHSGGSETWKINEAYSSLYGGKQIIFNHFLFIIVGLCYLVDDKTNKYRKLIIFSLGLSILVVLLSSTRGAYLALIIGLVFYLLMKYLRKTISITKLRKYLLLIFISISFLAVLTFSLMFKNEENNYLNGRQYIWSYGIEEISSNPFTLLFGKGVGASRHFLPSIEQIDGQEKNNFHNILIESAFEVGLVGMILLLVIIYYTTIHLIIKYHSVNKQFLILIAGSASVWVYLLLNSQLNDYMIWLYLSYLIAYYKINFEGNGDNGENQLN